MKVSIERAVLLSAWQIVVKYVPKASPKESLSGIRLSAETDGTITLEASDLKSAVKYPVYGQVAEAGRAVLNVPIFGEMLKKSGTKQIELETTEKRGTLTTEAGQMRFALIPAETFPQLPESSAAEEVCEIGASDFVDMVTEGSSAASSPSDFPKYMGTSLLRSSEGKMLAVSTDGRRLAYSRKECEVKSDTELVLPASSLKDLVRDLSGDGTVRVKADSSTVWFLAGGAEYAIRRIEATFPNYERILNDEVQARIRVNRKVLLSALGRIAVIASNNPNRIMGMSLKDGLKLRARASGVGTVRESVNEARIDGVELLLGFNVDLLMEGLKATSSEEVLIELSGAEEQARMYNSDSRDFLYMIMPVRLSADDLSDDDFIEDSSTESDEEGGYSC